MIELVSSDKCTGCGACAYSCPLQCIEMKEDPIRGLLPTINHDKCVECGKCQRICPILNPVDLKKPIHTYAARSLNIKESETSASGGIACTLYRHALNKGYNIVGAAQQADFSVTMQAGDSEKLVDRFKNSKYVFSNASDVYPDIAKLLKENKKIIIIGLPCQIAAIRKIFKENPNLLLVDIVCHGTTPTQFLKQHISSIETVLKKKCVDVSFRDPRFKTYSFTFSLSDKNGNCIYAKRTKDGDTYQYGYHRAISYRENCYQCLFANVQRTGDISLADYPGLGNLQPFPYKKDHINCVLINSEKGDLWFKELINEQLIEAFERPIKEAVDGNGQLRSPVSKSNSRLLFEKRIYYYEGDFEKAITPLMKKGLMQEKIKSLVNIPNRAIKKIIRTFKK